MTDKISDFSPSGIEGKILAVDFGDVRTGLAVSDRTGFLASGLGYISPGGIIKTADAVAEKAKLLDVSAIVVGLPVNMDGSEGKRASRCREFAALVKERLPEITVSMADERLTTAEAYRYLASTGTRGKKRKAAVDQLAAEIILQQVLDKIRITNSQNK